MAGWKKKLCITLDGAAAQAKAIGDPWRGVQASAKWFAKPRKKCIFKLR